MRSFARRLVRFWWGQGIADDAPSLTYYLVLSLGPFALGVAALEALLLDDRAAAVRVAEQINRFLPETLHGDISRIVIATRDESQTLLLIAVAAMLWTTSGAIGVIERCESRILDDERHSIVVGRIRNMVLGLGVALAVAVSAAGAPYLSEALGALNVNDLLPDGWRYGAYALGSIVVFAVVYRYAPRTTLRWRSALLGAIPAGIAVQGVPTLVGLYVGATARPTTGRLLLVLAVVLLGLWLLAALMLVGAGVAVNVEQRFRGDGRPHIAGVPIGTSAEARARRRAPASGGDDERLEGGADAGGDRRGPAGGAVDEDVHEVPLRAERR